MWVRTQDKMQLVKISEIHIKVDKDGFVGIWVDDKKENLKYFLGTYKSKERALEVLDEIQNRISPDFNFNGNDKEADLFVKTQILNSMIIIYQMPKE